MNTRLCGIIAILVAIFLVFTLLSFLIAAEGQVLLMSSFNSPFGSSPFANEFDTFPKLFSFFSSLPSFPCLTNWYPELGFPDWGRLAFISAFGKALKGTENTIVDGKTTTLRNIGGKENNATIPKGALYVLNTQKDTINGTTVLIVKTINGTAARLLSEPRFRSHWKQNLEPSVQRARQKHQIPSATPAPAVGNSTIRTV